MSARGATAWLTALAMLVVAWFVAWITPDGEERIADPFSVTAEVGQRVTAGNLGVQVASITVADGVVFDGWHADGTWVVVALEAWLTQQESATLGRAYLTIGDHGYVASERPIAYDRAAGLNGGSLHIDLPQRGTLAFEIPADAAVGPATLELSAGANLPGLSARDNLSGSGVVTLALDLSQTDRAQRMVLPETDWVTP